MSRPMCPEVRRLLFTSSRRVLKPQSLPLYGSLATAVRRPTLWSHKPTASVTTSFKSASVLPPAQNSGYLSTRPFATVKESAGVTPTTDAKDVGLNPWVTYDELCSWKGSGGSFLTHPKFGRSISVEMKCVPLLAEALETNPDGLLGLQSLSIRSPDDVDTDNSYERAGPLAKKCEALVAVLHNLAERGQLREFRWKWRAGCNDSGNGRISPEVWEALSRNGKTLQVMDVEHTSKDGSDPHQDSWDAFPSDKYIALRRLALNLQHAYCFDASRLHTMVKGLTELRSLEFRLPPSEGPQTIALSGTYPHLRSFTLSSAQLANTVVAGEPSTRTFLSRHPGLEQLSAQYLDLGLVNLPAWNGYFKLRAGDLPNLRTVEMDFWSMDLLLKLAIKLPPGKLEGLKIDFTLKPRWGPLARYLAGLRYLDVPSHGLVWSRPRDPLDDQDIERMKAMLQDQPDEEATDEVEWEKYEASAVEYEENEELEQYDEEEAKLESEYWTTDTPDDPRVALAELLRVLPSLTELRFREVCDSRVPRPDPDTQLSQFFDVATPELAPRLRAVTFVDATSEHQPMPSPEILADLPCSLPTLQYLGWQTKTKMALFKVERKEGKVVAVVTEPRNMGLREDLWLSEAVLDHFGDAAREW